MSKISVFLASVALAAASKFPLVGFDEVRSYAVCPSQEKKTIVAMIHNSMFNVAVGEILLDIKGFDDWRDRTSNHPFPLLLKTQKSGEGVLMVAPEAGDVIQGVHFEKYPYIVKPVKVAETIERLAKRKMTCRYTDEKGVHTYIFEAQTSKNDAGKNYPSYHVKYTLPGTELPRFAYTLELRVSKVGQRNYLMLKADTSLKPERSTVAIKSKRGVPFELYFDEQQLDDMHTTAESYSSAYVLNDRHRLGGFRQDERAGQAAAMPEGAGGGGGGYFFDQSLEDLLQTRRFKFFAQPEHEGANNFRCQVGPSPSK